MDDQMFELPLVAEGQDTLNKMTVPRSSIIGIFHSKFDSEKRCVVAITSSTKFSVAQSYEKTKAILYGVKETSDQTYQEGKTYYNDEEGTVIVSTLGTLAKRYSVTSDTMFITDKSYYSPPGKRLVAGTDYHVNDHIEEFGKVVYVMSDSPAYESTVKSIEEAK